MAARNVKLETCNLKLVIPGNTVSLASYSFGKVLARCWQGVSKDLARSRGLYYLANGMGAMRQVPYNRAANPTIQDICMVVSL